MTHIKTFIALFAIGIALSPLAGESAASKERERRFYLGIGAASFKTDQYDVCTGSTCKNEGESKGVMLYGGYRANEYFGAEIGGSLVKGFGSSETRDIPGGVVTVSAPSPVPGMPDIETQVTIPPIASELKVKGKYRNLYAAGTARLPIISGKLYLTGKLGMHYYHRKDALSLNLTTPRGIETTTTPGINKKKIKPLIGAGIEFQILNGSLRAEWTRFVGEGRDDMEVAGINWIYRF